LRKKANVAEARNGQDVLALLKSGLQPSVILLDLMMPVMSGWDSCHATEKDRALASVPIVVLSAYTPAPPRAKELSPVGSNAC